MKFKKGEQVIDFWHILTFDAGATEEMADNYGFRHEFQMCESRENWLKVVRENFNILNEFVYKRFDHATDYFLAKSRVLISGDQYEIDEEGRIL